MRANENRDFAALSVNEAVDLLAKTYISAINSGNSPKNVPSVMLWGPPGVGKSQGVRQIAREIELATGKTVKVTDVRLLLFNPIDLRGIPTANAEKTLAVWLKPQLFQMDESEDMVNLLFLDEISAAPQSVQAAAYQLTLDRVVGEHRLPDNCFVLAAGNRVTDKSVAFKMPKALANRLLHLEIEGDFDSWQRWAVSSGINEKVLGFLSARNELLFGFDAGDERLAFATPRSWEMVSSLLNSCGGDVNGILPMIAGLIGLGAAVEFSAWCKVYSGIPKTEDIFNGTTLTVPKSVDGLYAVVSSMSAYAREHRHEYSRIGSSLKYAEKLPADFAALLMKNYESIAPDYIDELRLIPEFTDLARKRGYLRNGSSK